MKTDTTQSPSDAEIAELRAQYGVTSNGRGIKGFTKVADFVRAALSKWGTPQAVAGGEPVAWLSVDCIGERYLCFTRPDDDDPVRPLVFGDTAPQAVREPFTPAQQERMYRNRPNNVGKSASLAEWRRLEYIERAYDIAKGGRHG